MPHCNYIPIMVSFFLGFGKRYDGIRFGINEEESSGITALRSAFSLTVMCIKPNNAVMCRTCYHVPAVAGRKLSIATRYFCS